MQQQSFDVVWFVSVKAEFKLGAYKLKPAYNHVFEFMGTIWCVKTQRSNFV